MPVWSRSESAYRLWYTVAVLFASVVLAAGITMLYSANIAKKHVRESEGKWCSLVMTLDNAYHETPPKTTAGKNVAAEIHRLADSFECIGHEGR